MTEAQLIEVLALQKASKIGDITAKKLIHYCGSVGAIFNEKRKNLLQIDGIGSYLISDLFNPDNFREAEDELKFIKENKIKWHYYSDDSYPKNLKHCIDGPILIFQSGNITLKNQHVISIVGTRKITAQGIGFCDKLIEHLAPYNPVVVSGFAYGTDINAQKAAMNHNLQTIGCLAHGLNQIYPKQHKKYVAKVEEHGGFFTDFWSSDDFNRNNFLKRNRIIAGLSEATLIIESAEKGGSLVTAEIANSYNREVFAVPGRVTDSQSVGCNNLIKTQRAHLLSQPADVPFILNWKLNVPDRQIQKKLFVEMNKEEQLIYNFLRENGRTILDLIALRNSIPTFKAASILLNLELKGIVRPLPGKQFELI